MTTRAHLDFKDEARRAAFLQRITSAGLVGTLNVMLVTWLTGSLQVRNRAAYIVPIAGLSLGYFGVTCHKVYKEAAHYL